MTYTPREPYILYVIPMEGTPGRYRTEFQYRRIAVRHAELLINDKKAKAVIVYYKNVARQLIVHRPVQYVHIERI